MQKSAHNLAKPVEQQHQRMRTARLIYNVFFGLSVCVCVCEPRRKIPFLTYIVSDVRLAFFYLIFWDFAFCPAQRIRVFPEMLIIILTNIHNYSHFAFRLLVPISISHILFTWLWILSDVGCLLSIVDCPFSFSHFAVRLLMRQIYLHAMHIFSLLMFINASCLFILNIFPLFLKIFFLFFGSLV